MKSFILIFFLLCATAVADWTPIGYNDWKQGNERVSDFGRLPENYFDGRDWKKIDTTWQSIGDTLFTCHKAVVKARAWPDGSSEFYVIVKGDTIRLKRTLDRLILYDTLTGDRYDLITDLPLSRFTHEGRELYWSFPGGGYRLRKGFGRTASQVAFKPVLLDSVCKVYDKLPLDSITTMVDSIYWDEDGDSMGVVEVPVITTLPERVALGTVFKYEISGVSDSLLAKLTSRPGVNKKKLLKLGRRRLSITSNKLHFDGEENVQEIPVLQQWRKVGGDYYLCEYLMMWQLDSLHTVFPNRSVWHGATEQVEDMGVDDTYITQPTNKAYNYGANVLLRIARDPGDATTDTIALLRCVDIAAALGAGATVNSCSLHLPISTVNNTGVITMYRLWKYWIEGTEIVGDRPLPDSGATFEMFQGIAFRLGLAGFAWAQDDVGGDGPDCAKDDGVDNVINGGTCVAARADRTETAMSSNNVNATGWWKWEVTTSVAQAWYGSAKENGVLLQTTAASVSMNSSDATGDINGPPDQPFFRWRYEVAAGQVILID